MAYDKIIPIRRRMVRCIDYVLNEDKTDLANALHYTENPTKTQRLVTGVNCTPETALEEMNATKRRWSNVYCGLDMYDAVKGADALLLLTEWRQFRIPAWQTVKSLMKTPLIIDGRNVYDGDELQDMGFIYHCIGR